MKFTQIVYDSEKKKKRSCPTFRVQLAADTGLLAITVNDLFPGGLAALERLHPWDADWDPDIPGQRLPRFRQADVLGTANSMFLPSGKHTKNNGTSTLFMGKFTK